MVGPPAVGKMSVFAVLLESFQADHQLEDVFFLVVRFFGKVQGAVGRPKHRFHDRCHDSSIGRDDDLDRHEFGIKANESREIASEKRHGGPDVGWEFFHGVGVYPVGDVACSDSAGREGLRSGGQIKVRGNNLRSTPPTLWR